MIRKVFEQLQMEELVYPLKSRSEIVHEEAVDQLYAAFSEYEVCMPPCNTCFPDAVDMHRRFASIRDVRKASVSVVASLYWEGPYCGGSSNWKRFFPVMMLSGLWDHGGCDLFDRAVGAGMWAWPETEQTVIRDVVVSAFLDWSSASEATPLGYDPMRANPHSRTYNKQYLSAYDIGIFLITAVLLCRVDPISVYLYLLEQDSSKSRALLARLIDRDLDFWGWGVISDEGEGLKQYAYACRHLAQQMVSEERLIQWYMEATTHEATHDFFSSRKYYSSVVDRHYFGDLPTNPPSNKKTYDVFKEAFENSSARII